MTMQTGRILVTGGAGFIGSALIRALIAETACDILNVDALTYAADPDALAEVAQSDRYRLAHLDIRDQQGMAETVEEFRPQIIVHLAAETHVDRSIHEPSAFVQANLMGTYALLAVALGYFRSLDADDRATFRFHHVSTDEVFGSLGVAGAFNEGSAYDPHSPYSATKAGSDHLVRAWHHSFGLPIVMSNGSNAYGPWQFPDKLIPLTIAKCLSDEAIPVYGDGQNSRDWLHVDDHVRALRAVFERGTVGETYLVGGRSEKTNLDVVRAICALMDTHCPRPSGQSHLERISFVPDRPGHDFRYAIDGSKIESELGWRPQVNFETGLEKTVLWYIDNQDRWRTTLPVDRHLTGSIS